MNMKNFVKLVMKFIHTTNFRIHKLSRFYEEKRKTKFRPLNDFFRLLFSKISGKEPNRKR